MPTPTTPSRTVRFALSTLAITAITLITPVPGSAQQAFTPGNIVVVRVGDGTNALIPNAAPVSLAEYRPDGTFVRTVDLPSLVADPNRFTLVGSAPEEGTLSVSADGRSFLLAGYRAEVGDANPASAASDNVNRVIAVVGVNGSVNTSQALTDAYSGASFRSVATDNGSRFWLAGRNEGVRYVSSPTATTSTVITDPASDLRVIATDGTGLFVSSSGTSPGKSVHQVGAGLPTTAGQAFTASFTPNLPSDTYQGFYPTRLGSGEAWNGYDTLYVVNRQTSKLEKWTFTSGAWTLDGTSNVQIGLSGLNGVTTGGAVTLYATTSTPSSGGIFTLTDGSGFDGTLTAEFADLGVIAGPNFAFRGIAIVPILEPTTTLLVGVAALGAFGWLRQRRAGPVRMKG